MFFKLLFNLKGKEIHRNSQTDFLAHSILLKAGSGRIRNQELHRVSHMGGREHVLGLAFYAFPGAFVGSWVGSETSKI